MNNQLRGKAALLILALMSGAPGAWSEDLKTIQGEVVDPALYLRETESKARSYAARPR